jgi:membrane associated rhomboid family serine protease
MTTFFLIVTILVSLSAFQNHSLYSKLIFNPYSIHSRKQWYRFFSSGFIHADLLHLAINMLVLYSIGGIVEFYYSQVFGDRGAFYFFLLYMSSLMFSLLPTYNSHKMNPSYNGLGASGAVSAVVFAFILFDPVKRLCLYGFICLPGIIFGVLYLGYCYYMGKRGGDNINHSAHLWGAVYGLVFTILLKPALLVNFFERIFYFSNAL